MERTGLMVLIYWFMHSYFGVGSLRNALEGMTPTAGERVLALCYGISWLSLAAGGLIALRGTRRGAQVARIGAGAAAVLNSAGLVMYGADIADLRSFVFLFSRPVADGYLFALLSRPAVPDGMPVRRVTGVSAAAGALLPLLAWVPARLVSGGPLALSREPVPLIVMFLCLWSALPFLFLALAASTRQDPGVRARTLFGGFAGTFLASLYAYSLIWSQQFNVFLLALLPPVAYAGQALGILASRFLPVPGGKDSSHTSH